MCNSRSLANWILPGLMLLLGCGPAADAQVRRDKAALADVETKLRPLAQPLPKTQPGDWLAQHKEAGQTFAQYVAARPVRKSDRLTTIYVCQIGEFSREQEKILALACEYLGVVYQVPVKRHSKLALADIPARAQRTHPQWRDKQILTTYVLDEVLKSTRPDDALAYLAFTSSDLYPQDDWNFVFGQANLRERVGVWSIYRFGDPAESDAALRKCLRRTLSTASHETGHILTIQHCTAFACNMNGSNSLPESDRQPLHFCPVCLRKVCWNLQVDPAKYLAELEAFCRKHKFAEEAEWYARAREALTGTRSPPN
ncbi:MAG TPA: archaemetzincin [Pirellulaceae bacterium]|nr:archaemetzincin [Pirellulaceae bacterium]